MLINTLRMKNLLFFLAITISLQISCTNNASVSDKTIESKEEMVYDSLLASRLGADDYGMKQYVMAFLKKGPNRSGSKESRDSLQRAHLDNIGRLAEEGKLVLAGPFLDDGDIRGIYIFDVKNLEEAQKLTASDPAIMAGSLEMELHPWYGSAGVTEINNIHKKVSRIDI